MSSVENLTLNDIVTAKLMENRQNAQMAVLEKSIEVSMEIEARMVEVLSQLQPHLGSNINLEV